jgi:actin cytoskeleton-regulatory complex protein SLA1
MASEEYLAVLKASYDYEPQSDDEIAIKEGQLLFLLERVDDESVFGFSPLISLC